MTDTVAEAANTEEVVDRVAKALAKWRADGARSIGAPSVADGWDWDNMGDMDKKFFREQSRAAIEAMRAPSAKMWRVGREVLRAQCRQPTVGGATDIYRAMIDAALT